MPTDCEHCGSNFDNDLAACPHCGANNPRHIFSARMKAMPTAVNVGLTKSAAKTKNGINTIRDEIDKPLEKYTMTTYVPDPDKKGQFIKVSKQSATTTVVFQNGEKLSFKTTDQMHSEMVALDHCFSVGEYGFQNGSVYAQYKITEKTYFTTEPHCGFCTVILRSIGMPLGTPTAGNGQMAGNGDYPLPEVLRKNIVFYANLVSGTDDGDLLPLKLLLNSFIKGTWYLVSGGDTVSDKGLVYDMNDENQDIPLVTWNEIVQCSQGEVIKALWAYLCKQIYETNKEAAH